MATDITKSIAANAAKHGTAVVLGATANPLNNNTINEHGLSVPSVSSVEGRYDTRFDDTNYYGSSSSLTNRLKASYRLDEASGTRIDLSSSNQDLTDNNTVGSLAGKQESAASFIKTNNEYLSISNSSLGGLSPGSIDFSVGFWVYINSGSTFSTNQAIAGIWKTASGNREWVFSFSGGDSTIRFYTSSDGAVSSDYITTASLSADTWYNIVGIHDNAGGSRKLYVDNSLVDNDSDTGVYSGDGDFTMGTYHNHAGSFLDGRIDEFNLWHKVLSTDDISSFYNSGDGIQVR